MKYEVIILCHLTDNQKQGGRLRVDKSEQRMNTLENRDDVHPGHPSCSGGSEALWEMHSQCVGTTHLNSGEKHELLPAYLHVTSLWLTKHLYDIMFLQDDNNRIQKLKNNSSLRETSTLTLMHMKHLFGKKQDSQSFKEMVGICLQKWEL